MYIVMNNTVAFRSTFAEMTYFVVCKIRLISLCVKFGLLYQLFHNVARDVNVNISNDNNPASVILEQ